MPTIILLTFGIMILVGFCHFRNGLFSSLTILVQVLLAGLFAFNFWEPIADQLDSNFQTNRLLGYEDAIVLTVLFTIAMVLFRVVTNRINPAMIDYQPYLQQIGGGVLGLFTGYLVAGFLCVILQTLPLPVDVLGFEGRIPTDSGLRSYMPPDRVWLSLMRFAGFKALAGGVVDDFSDDPIDRHQVFDRQGTFEIRYSRYRRMGPLNAPMPYGGEFDKELERGSYKK